MLSPALENMARENLDRVNKEIATFVPNDHGHWGEEYFKQLKEHQAMWKKFLGR